MGVSIHGFKSACRLVLFVDGSFLKHKCGEHILIAIALDANNQLYPFTFAMVDYENNNSLMYFMLKLRKAIGEVENLVFISNRHISITNALSTVFPEAHHGARLYHIKMNINHKFKTDHCDSKFDLAAYAYRVCEFHLHFEKIKLKDPRIVAYLEEIGKEKWSRAYLPGIHYNVMTSNYAESFDNKSRDTRKLSIIIFADFLRFTPQDLFYKRRCLVSACNGPLTTYIEK